MSPDTTVSPSPALVQQRARTRRADRFEARRVLWTESGLDRVKACGRNVVAGNTAGVALRVSGKGSARVAGFGGLQTCGSVWSCPVCASKVAASRQADLTAALGQWDHLGRGVVMVTLTMRHQRGQALRSLWDGIAYAWEKATTGRGWVSDQRAHGVLMARTIRSGARAGEVVSEVRIPTVRVVEVTNGQNGWHVHVHALLFLEHAVSDATADELGRSMFERWSAALVRKGFSAPLVDLGGMEAHAGTGDLSTFGDYFTKAQYDGAGLALEVTRGDLKDGRLGNRTPFQVLRDVYTSGLAEDLAIWHEWERGSKGRRQIAWSPGLRELVALPEVEKTDEQIAAEDIGGTVVAYVDEHDFARKVAPIPGRSVALLALLEDHDDGGYAACLQLWEWNVGCYWRGSPSGVTDGGPPSVTVGA